MVQETHGLQHLNKRKRIHNNLEHYPHPNKYKNFLDKFIYTMGIIGPIMTIPQIAKIWYYQNAAGVSAISWGVYTLVAITWILYGIAHKEKPIIFSNAIWVIMDILVVIGAILYG